MLTLHEGTMEKVHEMKRFKFDPKAIYYTIPIKTDKKEKEVQ